MYVPKAFVLNERNALISFIRAHPFGILVSARDGKPLATHVPFIVLDAGEPLTLGLHVAKANPHWKALDRVQVLAIFHGPHDFVSASWYADPERSVPTWNYSAVHCAGTARLANAAQTQRILETLVRTFEARDGWSMDEADCSYIEGMKRGIVAIDVAVNEIQGVLKYSQNRSNEDRERVLTRLDRRCPELAKEMRAHR
jgi:transcriptional regulator